MSSSRPSHDSLLVTMTGVLTKTGWQAFFSFFQLCLSQFKSRFSLLFVILWFTFKNSPNAWQYICLHAHPHTHTHARAHTHKSAHTAHENMYVDSLSLSPESPYTVAEHLEVCIILRSNSLIDSLSLFLSLTGKSVHCSRTS